LPLGVICLGERALRGAAGIVDEYVYAAKPLCRCGDKLLDLAGARDIRGDCHQFRAAAGDFGGETGEHFRPPRADCQFCPFSGEAQRSCPPDARAAADDHRNTSA